MKTRILVIEDNPTNLDLMTYLLNAFGYEALSAADGGTGLELARRTLPALVICDIGLPGLDGYAVAAQMKKQPALREIPLVAVTALAMVGDRDKALASGFDGYIPKPIDPQTFVAQVAGFLPKAAPADASAATPARWAVRATVLVVDDSPVNIELTRSILEPNGYHIVEAHTIREALALARAHPPDLILSDLHLPGEDGYAFINAVARDPQLRSIPVVFISSTIWHAQDRHRGLVLGAAKFLLRPIESAQLLAELEEVLKK
jgi:two-component system cell cycle response regulator